MVKQISKTKKQIEPVSAPKTLFKIASKKVDCEGVIPQKCLLVKMGDQKEWENFYDNIEGFVYEEGYEYVIEVVEEKIKNPPADGSSIKYKMVKQISKIKSKAD